MEEIDLVPRPTFLASWKPRAYIVLSTNNQLRAWSTADFLDKRYLGLEGFARFDGVLDRGFGRSRWVSYDFTTHDLKEGE
jgi:hypothetical protein